MIKICYITYYQGFIADFVFVYSKKQFTFVAGGVFLNIKKFVICQTLRCA